jgi:RNA polymerase sigma factor (sigma-70 family)
MQEMDDMTLLREFATNESHEAFEILVARYADLVYSAALRQVRNPHTAQEVTQAVFIILAQKAQRISSDTILIGWLYKTTRFTAMAETRRAIRRHQYEEAFQMESNDPQPAPDSLWDEMAPMLDQALAKLGEKDRQALLLRFFENRELAEVGAFLGASENTAGKRVTRAVEKLRGFMARRGVVSSATLIAGAISANSIQAAPVGLTSTIVATAVKGSAVAASTLTLVKGTTQIMNWIKLKLALGVTGAVLLAGAVATVAVSHDGVGNKNSVAAAQKIAKKSQEAYAALTSYSDNGTTVAQNDTAPQTTTFNIRLQRTNLYRIDWAQSNQFMTTRGVVWSDGTGDFMEMGVDGQKKGDPQKMKDRRMALASATGVSSQAAATIPAAFFKENWGDVLALPASGRADAGTVADEKVGDVDCYVITNSIDPKSLSNQGELPDGKGRIGKTTTKLWIGKKDYLIRKSETSIDMAEFQMPVVSDATIKKALAGQNRPATPEAIAAMRKTMEATSKAAIKSLKSGAVTFTQTHENIRVNEKFTAADFQQ